MDAVLICWLVGVALQLCQAQLWSQSVYFCFFTLCIVIISIRLLQSKGIVFSFSLNSKPSWTKGILFCLLFAGTSFSWSGWLAWQHQNNTIKPVFESQDITVTGRVCDLPQKQENRYRFLFCIDNAEVSGQSVELPKKVLLNWYFSSENKKETGTQATEISSGQRWKFDARLKAPHGNMNPHGFDYELWLWEQGIGATGYVRTGKASSSPQLRSENDSFSIASIREAVRTDIFKVIPDQQQAGLLAALTLGDQQAISRADWKLFRDSGVAHLVSISGLHITMIAWLGFALLGWLWRRSVRLMLWLPAHSAAAMGGLLCALCYALFAGWGIPAQRTVLMLTTVVLLRLVGIRWPWYVTLLFVACVVTVFDPWALLQPGFWLSFVAVGVLLAQSVRSDQQQQRVSEVDQLAVRQIQRPWWQRLVISVFNACKNLLMVQFRISIALAPLTLLLFQQVSVVGLLANVLAIPWVTFVMVPLSLLGIIWHSCWHVAAWAGGVLIKFLQWVMTFPGAVWESAVPPLFIGIVAVLASIFLVMPFMRRRDRFLCLPLMAPAFLWSSSSPPLGEFEVLALDVGQGSAVLVRTANHALLYDTGASFSEVSDAGRLMIVPALRALGVHLDKVVISHIDTDHSGGLRSVFEAYPAAGLLASASANDPIWQLAFREKQACTAGISWVWDDVQFTVLHPFKEVEALSLKGKTSTNRQSCVLQIVSGKTDSKKAALLTGDIEVGQERTLIERLEQCNPEEMVCDNLRADWLLVPHHGSRTSSSDRFVAAVAPRWGVVQSGYLNRFSHPHQDVVERYKRVQTQIINTVSCGAALWRSSEPDKISCEREQRKRYWHHHMN